MKFTLLKNFNKIELLVRGKKMQQISRHLVHNIDFIAKKLNSIDEELSEDFDLIQERPQNLGSFSRQILRSACISILAESPHNKTIDYMTIALTTGIANFQSAQNPGKKIIVDLEDKKLSFKGIKTTAYIDTSQWQKLFYLAVILRDFNFINILNSVPESLMRKSDIIADEANYPIIRFYKGLYDKRYENKIGSLLIKALEAIAPGLHEGEREDYLLFVKGPELDLYGYFFSDKQEEYQQHLAESILNHKQYWGTDERDHDREGWISLPLTAACAIAYDNKGYSPEVDSPYVPLWLVKREF
ncbi:MAG: immunity 49 family protein [Prochloraceae cyanobacterium]